MRCPRCQKNIPDGASLCRLCGFFLDDALKEGAGAGSGFTSPSLNFDLPPAKPHPTTAPGKPALPPEFEEDGIEVDMDGVDGGATMIDVNQHLTPSEIQRLQRGESLDARDRSEEQPERTQLSDVPEAVLALLRGAPSMSPPPAREPEPPALTERWERPTWSSPSGPQNVGADDETVVRRPAYSSLPGDQSTPSSDEAL